jgi:hypothetical protein
LLQDLPHVLERERKEKGGRQMGFVGRQFSHPRDLMGRLVGRAMERGNAAFNRWVIETVAATTGGELNRIVDLGCGPGVGLEKLLVTFPMLKFGGSINRR